MCRSKNTPPYIGFAKVERYTIVIFLFIKDDFDRIRIPRLRLKKVKTITLKSISAEFLNILNWFGIENDFWTPLQAPLPLNFIHGSYMLDMDMIDHVAAALGPLACPSRSARPRKCLN